MNFLWFLLGLACGIVGTVIVGFAVIAGLAMGGKEGDK